MTVGLGGAGRLGGGVGRGGVPEGQDGVRDSQVRGESGGVP